MISRTRDGECGAAAVEFALLVPLLFALLFGIIDYGLWFNDSLNVRQGVREAARRGVVQNFAYPECAGTQPQRLACAAKDEIGAVTGPTYVRVSASEGWGRGRSLTVCGMVKAGAVTGLAPLPADGLVKSKTSMSIEVTSPGPTSDPFVYQDTVPEGVDWSWCE
ncbi:MAG: TadE/TadG family type IV pilus assembly protein [Nocardioidaceae bacterium]